MRDEGCWRVGGRRDGGSGRILKEDGKGVGVNGGLTSGAASVRREREEMRTVEKVKVFMFAWVVGRSNLDLTVSIIS